jgi:hypothetical protein
MTYPLGDFAHLQKLLPTRPAIECLIFFQFMHLLFAPLAETLGDLINGMQLFSTGPTKEFLLGF